MIRKTFFGTAVLGLALALHAGGLTELNFVTDEALKASDMNGIGDEIKAVLDRFDAAAAGAGKFAESVKAEDAELSRAVTKRLEIAARLKDYINLRRDASGEMQIMAWQGAKELAQLLTYFQAEEDNFNSVRAVKQSAVLSVKDFGAKGDGKTDDGPAFRRAVAAAEKMKDCKVTLKIPAGTYFIKPSAEEWKPQELKIRAEAKPYSPGRTITYPKLAPGHIVIANMDNFTIAGEKGTMIVFGDATMLGFRIVGCRNMTLKNFSIDYGEYPFTQGKIVRVEQDPFALVFEPQKGYPAPNEKRFMTASARRFTPHQPDGLYGPGTVRMGKIETIDGGLYRLYPQEHDKKHHVWLERKAGDTITVIARFDAMAAGEASALDLRECGFCQIRDVTVHKSPGVGFRVFNNYALRMVGCRIEPLPGSGDLITTNADGCQTTGIIGPYISGCYFSGMEDDGFNIHSSSPELADIVSGNSTRPFASQGGFLISGLTGKLKALLRPMPNGHPAYTKALPADVFSRKMVKENLTAHQKEALNYYGGRAHLFTDRPDRITQIPGDLSGTVVCDTEFFNVRGMALQLTAPNILVENCKIRHMNSYGINISALLPWGMTFNPHNVVIRNTVIDDTVNPSISIRYRAIERNGFCEPRFINSVLIDNCEITQRPWCAVELRNASDVKITNCRFYQSEYIRTPQSQAIYCDNFADFTAGNLVFNVRDKAGYIPIKLKSDSEEKYITEENIKIVQVEQVKEK